MLFTIFLNICFSLKLISSQKINESRQPDQGFDFVIEKKRFFFNELKKLYAYTDKGRSETTQMGSLFDHCGSRSSYSHIQEY